MSSMACSGIHMHTEGVVAPEVAGAYITLNYHPHPGPHLIASVVREAMSFY